MDQNDSLFFKELDDVEKWALEHTTYTRFSVNYGYNGDGEETFWQGAGGDAYRFAASQAGARHFANGIWFVLPKDEADALIYLFQRCPGWYAESDHNPHATAKFWETVPTQDGKPHPVRIEEGLTREQLLADVAAGR